MPLAILHRLPMSVRLPLAMVTIVLVTALGSTQIATRSLSAQIEAQLDQMGQVYLDGLAASVMPSVLNRDAAGIQLALDESLRVFDGVQERRLFMLDADHRIVARADREGLVGGGLPSAVLAQGSGDILDEAAKSYWVWRPLIDERSGESKAMTLVANLDVADFAAERKALWWQIVAFNFGLGVLCALMGLLLMRRLLRPISLLTRHLQQGQTAGPSPLAEHRIPASDKEAVQLVRAYNSMAGAAREREGMLAAMALQEREAVLGRLAATLAHEVRNPLAGVMTAIETLRKFGDRQEVREEALDFMERGMRALAEVTDATLATHRPPAHDRGFGPQDLIDVQRLVSPQAERAGVTLRVESDLTESVPVAAGEVRQVLLNLLLNAVKASSVRGIVQLRCTLQARHLRLEVGDEGIGLPEDVARSLERGAEPVGSAGLGMAVIVRLMRRLRGRVAVNAPEGRGTHIVMDLPLDVSNAAEQQSAP